MELSTWAESHAGDLLSPLGRRWLHARAVADAARQLTIGLAPEDAGVLVAAAYLHNIGYAPALAITGFHPLDGARHLRELGHERLAGLVAHHTHGRYEPKLRGLSDLSQADAPADIFGPPRHRRLSCYGHLTPSAVPRTLSIVVQGSGGPYRQERV